MHKELLRTKLYAPRVKTNLVPRPELIKRLITGNQRGAKLTLIAAPAGYGKTTLLTEWISQSEMPFCWLSLDKQDNDLGRLLSYILAGLQSINIVVDEKMITALHSQQSDKYEVLIISLINQISAKESPFALVLDDYHLIESQEIHKTLTFLLENHPHRMHLVIATRTDPPLHLAQLRARGELCEVRSADLSFTVAEATSFFNHGMRLDLKPSDVTTLTNKTEGWIAGLQLAAIALQGHRDKEAFVRAFAGDDRYIADYLLDEALLCQPTHIQTFLLQTSILERFNASLCDAVTGRNDGQAILRELEHANLFLVPLDNQRNWYRYHQLFTDLLRLRSRKADRDSVKAFYQRASTWYEQHRMFAEAVKMALLGDDAEKVAQLMEGHLLAIVSNSELALMNQSLASVSDDAISDNPWLALATAWGMAYVWQLESVDPLLDKAIAASRDLEQNTRRRLDGRILVLQSYLLGCKRDYAGSIRIAQDALRILPDDDLSIRSFAILIIGNAHRFGGNLECAIEFHNNALSLSEEAQDIVLSVIILSRLTDIYRIMGQLDLAYQIGIQALEKVEYHQNQAGLQSFIEGYLKLRLSDVYYERNELEAARQCAEVGLDLARQWGAYDSISLGYFNLARIYQAQGNYRQADNHLREFKEAYPSEHRLQYKIASAIEAEVYLHVGNLQGANGWLESCGLSLSDPVQFQEFQFYDVLAQVFIARGQLADARSLLERLLRIAKESGAGSYEVQTLGRIALVLQEERDEDAAVAMLARALALAAPEGNLRVFLNQGESMAQLLYQAALQGIHAEFCNRILAAFSSAMEPDMSPQAGLVEPLSKREIEVLRHIALGAANLEIAQELVVSLYTVKSHARNIFSKLGVKNRTEAVAKARLLGILPQD